MARAKRSRSPKKDPQQYEVYALECGFKGAGYCSLTREEIKRLCVDVAEAYEVPPVTLRFRRFKDDTAGQCHQDGLIELSTRKVLWTMRVVLHELAHHVHNWAIKKAHEHQAHGPEFMACYIHLLAVARVVPIVAMQALCNKFNVKYIDPGERSSLKSLQRRVNSGATRKSTRHPE